MIKITKARLAYGPAPQTHIGEGIRPFAMDYLSVHGMRKLPDLSTIRSKGSMGILSLMMASMRTVMMVMLATIMARVPLPPTPIRIHVAMTIQTYSIEDFARFRQRDFLSFNPPPCSSDFVASDRFDATGVAVALPTAVFSDSVGGSDPVVWVEFGHGGEHDVHT